MECAYQSYSDHGLALKQLISNYQTLLIDEKILADGSAKSYRDIFKKFADSNGFDKIPSKYFYVEFQKLEKRNEKKLENCREQILSDSAMYSSSKLKAFDSTILKTSYSNNPRASIIAKEVLSVLSDKDFELDLYKLYTFMMFSYIDTEAGIAENAQVVKDYDPTNTLNISLTENKEILVNNQIVSVEELKKLVKTYLSNNKSESTILLKSHPDLTYGFYQGIGDVIIQEITALRNELSLEKFNSEYKALNKEQKTQIAQIYPQRIVEKTLK